MSTASTDEPTPIERAKLAEGEFEVWANAETSPPSVLVVINASGEPSLRILDPSLGNTEVLSSSHYLDIVAYLREEDYSPVKGRMKFAELDDDND